MVNSAKRAKRKRLAQKAQRKEASRPAHQMDPADLSEPGTDREEEDDHEIRFTAEESLPTPARVQVTTDCEIINMVKTLNGAIAAVSQDMARIPRAYAISCARRIWQGTKHWRTSPQWSRNMARHRWSCDLIQ